MTTTVRTQVAIVGAGPAGLMLAHLLGRAGVESIVIDDRTRDEIEQTIRAGILEQGTVEALLASGVDTRAHEVGARHDGIELRFEGAGHRIDFADLVGRGVWLYPQHEVLQDLLGTLLPAGQDIRFTTKAERVEDVDSTQPKVIAVDADGGTLEITADFVVGADGSHSVTRKAMSGSHNGLYREYPFAWFGILCEAPPSAPELIYSNSPNGFALISQRSDTVQRMYFQCEPTVDPNAYSEAELWEILQSRVPGTTLKEGRIFQRDVLQFRSFVARDLRRGRVALVGDAAHTVPPTGAKGMNLAIADVLLLDRALQAFFHDNDTRLLDAYEQTALHRIWKAQNFSWWMTSMTHQMPEASGFDRMRQLGELRSVTDSRAGRMYLAEAYTGWPVDLHI
ncbi:4-hydroxybenzoate 3-monooxygenase [Microbacterium kribbense]|uniref:4-hydroxybenzoate 3-monooxygenase n=1 Tax=Microbacterium kribbense TaxID=433645 RepID=A0ABP7G6M3_9MICO